MAKESKREILRRKIIRMSPGEEADFLKKLFKDKLGIDIDYKRAAISGYIYKYALGIVIIFILACAFLLVYLHPVLYITLLLAIIIGSIPFCSGASYYYFDEEKIINIREKGVFSPTYQTFYIYYRDISQIKAHTRSRKGHVTCNYLIRKRNNTKIYFSFSPDTHAIFINRLEIHLKQMATKFGFILKGDIEQSC